MNKSSGKKFAGVEEESRLALMSSLVRPSQMRRFASFGTPIFLSLGIYTMLLFWIS